MKSLFLAQFSRYKHFCVLQFLRKIRKFKMAAIFGESKFFLKIGLTTRQGYPVGQKFRKNFASLRCAIFVKNSKIQNGRHFWIDK